MFIDTFFKRSWLKVTLFKGWINKFIAKNCYKLSLGLKFSMYMQGIAREVNDELRP